MGLILNACVDDYQDANPTPLKDSPAVASVTIQDELLENGSSTKIIASVVDAPGGIDSVGVETADSEGDPIGSYVVDTPLTGQTKAEIEITYSAPENTETYGN